MTPPKCGESDRRGRLNKAKQFLAAAEIIETIADDDDLLDAHITLCVHAGIAAADAICCARLGVHAQGQNHNEAVGLLEQVDPTLAKELSKLLAMKTKAGYSSTPSTAANRKSVARSANHLVAAAEKL